MGTMNIPDPWNPDELELPEREANELAGFIAESTPPRRPPVPLKVKILAAARAQQSGSERPWRSFDWRVGSGLAAACALFLTLFSLGTRRPEAVLAEVRGVVTIDGQPAKAGAGLRSGQLVAVSEDGQAVITFGGRAAARLLRGAEMSFQSGSSIGVNLRRGWLLSAVVTGTPYRLEISRRLEFHKCAGSACRFRRDP